MTERELNKGVIADTSRSGSSIPKPKELKELVDDESSNVNSDQIDSETDMQLTDPKEIFRDQFRDAFNEQWEELSKDLENKLAKDLDDGVGKAITYLKEKNKELKDQNKILVTNHHNDKLEWSQQFKKFKEEMEDLKKKVQYLETTYEDLNRQVDSIQEDINEKKMKIPEVGTRLVNKVETKVDKHIKLIKVIKSIMSNGKWKNNNDITLLEWEDKVQRCKLVIPDPQDQKETVSLLVGGEVHSNIVKSRVMLNNYDELIAYARSIAIEVQEQADYPSNMILFFS